ncbi:acyltransferase [Fibrobacter succinogenes]|uniref:acyltransferase n=1 Tax=Fibrobacter succinogenes TaxID=833 RepID=UPI00156355E4|nr:acyltransferase [Fibrobacter succinogenes]
MSSIVRKIIRAPELYCALLMLVGVFCSQACQPKIENIVLSQNGIQREISLPLVEKLGDGAVFDVSFDIVQGIEIPFDLKVIPDDCADFVIINGQKEFLGLVEGHCNYSNGFVLPDSIISKYRKGLVNHFEFRIRNGGGNAGIKISPEEKSIVCSVLRYSILALLIMLCLLLGRLLPTQDTTKPAENRKASDYITFVIVVSAFAVLTLHTNNCFWWYTGKEDYWFSANIIECVFYFAVPLFFMVTGITLMDFFDRYTMKAYFSKRFMKTMLPFLVWSIVAIGIDLHTGKRIWSNIDLRTIFQDITGNRVISIYWFFGALFVLYLCMPLFAAVEKSKRKLVFSYLVIIAFVFNIFLPFLKKVFSSDLNTFFHVPVLVSYFIWPLLGWLLHNCEIKKWQKVLIHVLGLFGLALHICGSYVLSVEANHVVGTFKGYENVPSVLYAISIFVMLKDVGTWIMKKERLSRFVKMLGGYAFEVYLLQFILLDAAVRNPSIDKNSLLYRLGAPFVMIPIIMAFTWCLRKIPVVRRIVP